MTETFINKICLVLVYWSDKKASEKQSLLAKVFFVYHTCNFFHPKTIFFFRCYFKYKLWLSNKRCFRRCNTITSYKKHSIFYF